MDTKYNGLNDNEIIKSRNEFGSNELEKKKQINIIIELLKVLKEPTLLLLIIASLIYFILGEYIDGIIMLFCVLFTCSIEFIQGYKTDKALEELNKLSSLNVLVIRNNKKIYINSDEIVVGDIVILESGDKVPADGIILLNEGLSVDESLLTGESIVVNKTTKEDNKNYFKTNICYKGTNVVNGNAIIKIISVGKNTEYGKIGTSLNQIEDNKSILDKQIDKIIMIYGILSIILFISVFSVTFINNKELSLSNRIIEALISSITIGIATIPEEIPVILTIFLAMGASKLAHENTLVKNMKSVENLGRITVFCTDKTGTITENKMKVFNKYILNDKFYESAYFACHNNSYDPTEIAIRNYIKNSKIKFENNSKLVHEYLFSDETKMMGIVLNENNKNNLYVKGAYEYIIKLCELNDKDKIKIDEKFKEFSNLGLRVIAIANKESIKIKENINDYKLNFLGLIALDDPIRKHIKESINTCYNAGIRTILITGDSDITASAIAKKIGIKNSDNVLTGDQLERMDDTELIERVKDTNIFARVYPNHKMRIVNALQKNNEVVAMTGDGINDSSALKKADIGISMGLRGTNVAKEASDIILLDDNFNTIVKTIKNGRNIYNNIKKAISYVIVIHIPIALLSFIIPIFKLPPLLLPIHIVLLELLIDPTCSIIFEKIKPDKNIMNKPPRNKNENILDLKTLTRCIFEGLMIFIVVFITYYYYIKIYGHLRASTVSYTLLIMCIIMTANTLKNRDLTIINFINGLKDKTILLINSLILFILLMLIYVPFLQIQVGMCSITLKDWVLIIILSLLVTIPFDITKKVKK